MQTAFKALENSLGNVGLKITTKSFSISNSQMKKFIFANFSTNTPQNHHSCSLRVIMPKKSTTRMGVSICCGVRSNVLAAHMCRQN